MYRSCVTTVFKGISVLLSLSIMAACSEYGHKFEINNGEVFYKRPVTKDQARGLGEFLVEDDYFSGSPASVQLLKESDRYLICFVVKPGTEEDLDLLYLFRHFAGMVSPRLFAGLPVDVELCDENFSTMHKIKGASYGTLMTFELDNLYFKAPVNEEEAQKFMQFLKTEEFFIGEGISVLLKKTENGFEMYYPIQEKIEDFAGYLDAVKILADQISQVVFSGNPFNIHLCDKTFTTEHVVRSDD